MKSILRRVAGPAIAVTLAFGMFSCSNGSKDEPVKETVATPTFSVAAGELEKGTNVTITCATEGAKIYYTIDESEPTASSTEYTDAIKVTEAVTIKAIAVKNGMNDSAVASASYTTKAPDYSKCVVGDFILNDGTILSKDETPESGTVAAVIVRAASEEKPTLGVGIVNKKRGIAWCITAASGYTNIIALQGDQTSGYMDGGDGWEILKTACPDAEENPEYYPAWNYCLTYGATNGISGDLANGWYLPTVAELLTISQNKTTVDSSFSKLDGVTLGNYYYWSSCQSSSTNSSARIVALKGGGLDSWTKNDLDQGVCAVRAFN